MTHSTQGPRPNAQGPSPRVVDLLLDGAAVIWVVVVGAQYVLVMLLPGAPDVSASYPALLAGVGITGIMRYFLKKRARS
jgi:hypothetical protein